MATKAELQERITELEETQSKVRAGGERFALAVEGSNDGVWDWEHQERNALLVPAHERVTGVCR